MMCAQAGSSNVAGSQLATRCFQESKGREKKRHSSDFDITVTMNCLGLVSTTSDPAIHEPIDPGVRGVICFTAHFVVCLSDGHSIANSYS